MVILSVVYESVKSVIFSLGNPPGSRVITVSFTSDDAFNILVATVILVIAWVVEEGQAIAEENKLTI